LMDWSHTKKRWWRNTKWRLKNRIPRDTGREDDQKIAAEDRLSKKRGEAGRNEGFWQLIEVERIRRQPTLLIGAIDSINIIIIILLLYYYIIIIIIIIIIIVVVLLNIVFSGRDTEVRLPKPENVWLLYFLHYFNFIQFSKTEKRNYYPSHVCPSVLMEQLGSHCIGGWMGLRAGLDVCGISRPQRDSIPGPSNL
jgi:hypothetical protein